jgi:hypothetical protein
LKVIKAAMIVSKLAEIPKENHSELPDKISTNTYLFD